MGIKHHLLSFIGINVSKLLAAITKGKMGYFDLYHLISDDHFVAAPIKLIGFPRGKRQRNTSINTHSFATGSLSIYIPIDGRITSAITKISQVFKEHLSIAL